MQSAYLRIPIFDLLSLLETEYQMFTKLAETKSDLLFSNPVVLIRKPQDAEPVAQQGLDYHLREPCTPDEQFRLAMHTFITIRVLCSKLNQMENQIEDELLDRVLNTIPLSQEGQEIVMNNRNLLRCNIQSSFLTVTGRTLPQQQQVVHVQPPTAKTARRSQPQLATGSLPRFLTFEQGYMYIVETNLNKIGYGFVRQAVPLVYLSTLDNTDNNFTLRLYAEKRQRAADGVVTRTIKLCDEVLVFDDVLQCKQVRQTIETNVANAISDKKHDIKLLIFGDANVPDAFEQRVQDEIVLDQIEPRIEPIEPVQPIQQPSAAKYYTK
jgi:hypothetical protein